MLFGDVSIPFAFRCSALLSGRIFCFEAAPKIGFKDRGGADGDGGGCFLPSPSQVVKAKPSYFAKHARCW